MDHGQLTAVLFLDLKKAFDMVNHVILLNKLQMYGVSPQSLQWFKNYLASRVQKTKVNGEVSTMREIKCGVPQGSILGLRLFII